ncbi:NAD-dependent epimerase/dehydratase family protein [Microlunatus ginsengisoli]|uniref:NAD(P)-dependent oxidoreductase n=1 Tax=Microlunatus ginsengisoli TaxID=363863 RepID=A0ABP7APL1_9ACTN
MRVLVVGATGAMGTSLVPRLVEAGHQVLGTTRSAARVPAIQAAGGEGVVLEVLDRSAVAGALDRVRPEVVIHQATALQHLGASALRNIDRAFAETNRLRTVGTENLLAAAGPAGVRRVVAQSFTGWTNEPVGGPVKTESDPFDPSPAANARQTLAAIRRLESLVTGAPEIEGVVLRYGGFYGPGTGLAREGEQTDAIRKRMFPVVGDGGGIWSFSHIQDAAAATVAALDGPPGIFNIVDDDPAPVSVWLPFLADALGAPPPRRIPGWLARPLLGPHLFAMMTSARGSSNAKARRELDWQPTYRSWREGFVHGLG